MNSRWIFAVSFAVLLNCVISDAKNNAGEIKNSSKNVTDRESSLESLNENIYTEGNSVVSPSKSRIKPRKGAVPDNSTEIIIPSKSPTNVTQETAIQNIISDAPLSTNSTLNVNNSSISNFTVPSINSSTLKPHTLSTITTSTTRPTKSSSSRTLATKKSVKKPTITYSADDNPQILESEKKIKFINGTNIEDITIGPKASSDTDRTIVEEEQRTRRNYIIYMGLAFALPMAFTLIHFSYKKIRNWLEIRHYERVVSYFYFLITL